MNDYIKIALEADPVGMVRGFREAETRIGKFHEVVKSAGKGVQAATGMLEKAVSQVQSYSKQIGGWGSAILLGSVAAAKGAANLESSLVNTQGLVGASTAEVEHWHERIIQMSQRMPQSAQEFADGLYDIASSGFSGAAALNILENAGISASAGMSTTKTASKAIVAALNAYGLEASSAKDISDILFQTVNLGVLSFEDMANGMGQWVGMAAQVGIAADEASAAIATMTLSGIQPDEAATYLSRVMEAFIAPSQAMKAASKDAGYASAKAMLDAEGLGGSLLKLSKTTGGNVEEFNALFGSIQASRGAMAIIANDGKNWNRVADKITDKTKRAGAAQRQYEYQSRTLNSQFKKLGNTMRNFSDAFGEALFSPLKIVLTILNGIIDFGRRVLSPFQAFFGVVRLVGGALAAVAGLVGLITAKSIVKFLIFKTLGTGLKWLITNVPILTKMWAALGATIAKVGASSMVQSFMGTKLGMAMKSAATSIYTSYSGGMIGLLKKFGNLDKVSKMKWVGIAAGTTAAAFAIEGIVTSWSDAKNAAKQYVEEVRRGINFNDYAAIPKNIEDLENRWMKLAKKRQELIGQEQTGFQKWWWNFSDALNPFNGARSLEANITLPGQMKGVEEMRDELEQRKAMLDEFAAATLLKSKNIKVRLGEFTSGWLYEGKGNLLPSTGMQGDFDPMAVFFRDLEGNAANKNFTRYIENYQQDFATQLDSLSYELARIAEVKGVSLDELLDPETGPKVADELLLIYTRMHNLSPAAKDAALAFEAVGGAASDAGGNIDKLNAAMKESIEEVFGQEIATDNFESAINDVTKAMQDLGEKGTLEESFKLDSFHEDAIGMRSNFRNIIGLMADETTAWAKSQEKVTGQDIENHLQGQIDKLRQYGQEWGVPTEFVNHYADSLQRLVNQRTISIAFSDNVPSALGRLGDYLAKLGLMPAQVTTLYTAYTKEGEDAMLRVLDDLNLVDGMQVEATIKLMAEKAYDDLNKFLTDAGVKKPKAAVVELSGMLGDKNQITGWASRNGLNDQQLTQLFTLLPTPESKAALDLLQTAKDKLAESKKIDLGVDPKALDDLNKILATLDQITGTRWVAKVDAEGNITTESGGPVSRKKKRSWWDNVKGLFGLGTVFAAGSDPEDVANGHQPKIHRHSPGVRVFNEPETRGEAYIPLANDWRRPRAVALVKLLANKFGIHQFFGGGIFRLPDKNTQAGPAPTIKASDALRMGFPRSYTENTMYTAPDGSQWRYVALYDVWQRSTPPRSATGSKAGTSGGGGFLSGLAAKASSIGAAARRSTASGKGGGGGRPTQLGTRIDSSLAGRTFSPQQASQNAAQAADDAAQKAREAFQKEMSQIDFGMETGAISKDSALAWLNARIKGLAGGSDEYMEVWRKINQITEDIKREKEGIEDIFHDAGAMDDGTYLQRLQQRFDSAKRGSLEQMQIWKQMEDLKKKIKDDDRAAQDAFLAGGTVSAETKKGVLVSRLVGMKQGSAEWHNIWKEINDTEFEGYQTLVKYGAVGNKEYQSYLKQRIALVQKFSPEWQKYHDEIVAIEAQGLARVADVFGKFEGKTRVSSGSLVKWMQKQIKDAQNFANTMAALKNAGYDANILNQIQAMGPQGGKGLASGLLQAANSGQAGTVQDLFRQATELGINVQTYDTGGYLPPGYTLAYNGTGAPEAVGGRVIQETTMKSMDSGVSVTFKDTVIANDMDLQAVGNQLGFAVRKGKR